MTAAQDYLVRELVAQINAKNAELATDPPANPGGIIFVTSRNAQAAPAYTVNVTLTDISGGALDIVETPGASAGVMGVTEIRIPAEIAAGDTVAFDTPGGVTISATVPDDYPNPGGYDRRLVVYENNPNSANYKRLFAIPPGEAPGVPIPAFTTTNTTPTAGSVIGQGIYQTTLRKAMVWDGSGWRDVTSSPIHTYATDAALQAVTTEPPGTYAIAADTGHAYVYMTTNGWRRLGISEFATYAEMQAWDAGIGNQAIPHDLNVVFLRTDDGAGGREWIPISTFAGTEVEILATQNVEGMMAMSTDTGVPFVNNGARWVRTPIEHFATEADLLAATPTEGHMAWSEDTGMVFIATGGAWKHLEGPQLALSATAPASPSTGDMWLPDNRGGGGLQIWDGRDADPTKHRWRDASNEHVVEREESNVGSMITLPTPDGWKELNWRMDGVLGARTVNATPVVEFSWKGSATHDLHTALAVGSWRGNSHTSWDYGSVSHVAAYEIRSNSSISIGWYSGSNRDIGQDMPFTVSIRIYAIGDHTYMHTDWQGIRSTLDHMVTFRGAYAFKIPPEDIGGLKIGFSGNKFYYRDIARFT